MKQVYTAWANLMLCMFAVGLQRVNSYSYEAVYKYESVILCGFIKHTPYRHIKVTGLPCIATSM